MWLELEELIVSLHIISGGDWLGLGVFTCHLSYQIMVWWVECGVRGPGVTLRRESVGIAGGNPIWSNRVGFNEGNRGAKLCLPCPVTRGGWRANKVITFMKMEEAGLDYYFIQYNVIFNIPPFKNAILLQLCTCYQIPFPLLLTVL